MDERPTIEERGRYRFRADRLPASQRSVVVAEEARDDEGLDSLDGHLILLSLGEDVPLREAERVAEMLNRTVRNVSLAAS
jgi:hypothetical protein